MATRVLVINQCVQLFLGLPEEELNWLIASHPTLNLPCAQVASCAWTHVHRPNSAYTLEFFKLSHRGHWRILRNGVRVAWGARIESLDNLLHDRPTTLLGNYMESGNRFSCFPYPVSSERRKVVFLIHGFGVRSHSMSSLARSLEQSGYQVFSYDYASFGHRGDIAITADFLRLLGDVWQQENLAKKEVFFLTHSNGGIILRLALQQMPKSYLSRIRAVVMLAPPNQGSGWASVVSSVLPLPVLRDLSLSSHSLANRLPLMSDHPRIGILRGKYDCKVSEKRVHFPGGQEDDYQRLSCGHATIRRPDHSLKSILDFFEKGHF